MNSKNILLVAILLIVVGGGSFYGGLKYAESSGSGGAFRRGDFSASARSGMTRGGAGFRTARPGGGVDGRAGGDFVSGEILSKDEKSIIVKLRDGGSKIVFLSEKMELWKYVTSGLSDLEVGKSVTVSGKTNSDGSLTANSIQIRPTSTLAR